MIQDENLIKDEEIVKLEQNLEKRIHNRRLSSVLGVENVVDNLENGDNHQNVEKHDHSLESIQNNYLNHSKTTQSSLMSLENAIEFKKVGHFDFRLQRIKELEDEYMTYITSNNIEKSIAMLKKLIFFDSENPSYYSRLGKLYLRLHDISSALMYLKKALSLDKNNKALQTQLENTILLKGIIKLEDEKHENNEDKGIFDHMNNEKQENFKLIKEEEEEKEDKSYHLYYLKALSFFSLGQFKMALNTVSKVFEFEKNHIDSILLMARIYNSMGDYSKSDETYWKAFSINPEQPEVKRFTSIKLKKMKECLVRVNSNILKEKFEMGLLWTTKALSHYPNHPKALMMRSAIYRRLNRLDEALIDLNLAAKYMNIGKSKEKVTKSICKTYNELAVSLIKEGTDEAYRMLNEAMKLDENCAETYFNLGLCLMERKEINRALETFQKCLKLNPKYPRAKIQISIIYYKMAIMSFNTKEYIEAINYIQMALCDKFDCADFYLLRGKCYLRLSQLNKAFEDILTCLKIDPHKQEAIEIKKSLNY